MITGAVIATPTPFDVGGKIIVNDLKNTEQTSGSQFGLGFSAGSNPGSSMQANKPQIGVGKVDEGQQSFTSGGVFTGLTSEQIDAKINEMNGKISSNFNEVEVKEKLGAQVAIMQAAGQLFPKYIGDEMD